MLTKVAYLEVGIYNIVKTWDKEQSQTSNKKMFKVTHERRIIMYTIQPIRRKPVSLSRNNLWSDFDNVFDGFFNEATVASKMKVDILDQDDKYVLEAELPGFDKEDIDVSLKEDHLTISVSHEDKEETSNGKYLRRERTTSAYSRTFYIEDIDEENIVASFENGVLNLVLPKQEAVVNEVKKIEIK